jgi:glycosyltransferase involved in cell wall biosynthesis
LVASVRRLRPLRFPVEEICCESINSIPFRDVHDVYLGLHGARAAVWRDAQGRRDRVQALSTSLVRVGLDLLRFPLFMARAHRWLRRLEKDQPLHRIGLSGEPNILYLRTDHWFDSTPGGSSTHTAGIVNALRRLNYPVRLVSSAPLPIEFDHERLELCEPIYDAGRNLGNIPSLLYNYQLEQFLVPRWPQWKPTLVYHRLSLLSVIGPMLRARFGVPYVCEYNGSADWIARHWDCRRLPRARLAMAAETLSLRVADLIIAVSDAAREELEARGIDPARIVVSPNAVDLVSFGAPRDGASLRHRLGLDSAVVLGFVGSFGPWHGVETLARAFLALKQRYASKSVELRLLLVGDGARRPAIEAMLQDAGAGRSVIFTGSMPQRQIPDYLAVCDILVCPHSPNPDGSRFAGSPTKLFEYMAAAKPIVASDLEQIGTVLSHGRTGWLVAPGDPAALAAGLEIVIESPRLRERLGAAARQAVEAEHSWAARAEQIVASLPRADSTQCR